MTRKLSRWLYCWALVAAGLVVRASAVTVFPVATNAGLTEISGGIAGSGSNFVVSLLSGTNVCFQLVSTNGTLTGSLTTLGHSQGTASFLNSESDRICFPTVAFGGANYLVTWYDTAAETGYGQIVSANGAPVGSAFSLYAGTNIVPQAVASDHTNFLVVLEDYGRNFYGQFVTGAGGLSGSPFLISSQSSNGKQAAAAFGRTNYFVLWISQNLPGNGDTNLAWGAFVSPHGSVTSPIQIGQTPAPDENPVATAFDGTNFLAVWNWDPYPETEQNVTNWNVFGRLISQSGAFPGNELHLVTDPGNDLVPAVTFDGFNYLLAWGYGANVFTNTTVRLQYLDTSGTPISPEFSLIPPQGTNTPILAFNGLAFDGTRYGLAATLTTTQLSSGEVYGAIFFPLPFLTAGNYSGNSFNLKVTGTPAVNYAVQMSTNLSLTNWTPLTTNSGSFSFTDTHATNPARFYRAVEQ